MKKLLTITLLFFALSSLGQPSTIVIEAKPLDPVKAFTFNIEKTQREIKIICIQVDSIGKIKYDEDDLFTIKRLIRKNDQFFDSLSNDSLLYFQRKIDSIRNKNTYYRRDSAAIYKSTHPAFWKLLETVFKTPDNALVQKQNAKQISDGTLCFFTVTQGQEQRKVYIEDIDHQSYPLLAKLVTDSEAIMKAHRQVMKRRNN